MTQHQFESDWFPEGYISFGGILPLGLSLEEIDDMYFSLNGQLQSISEPPVARLEPSMGYLITNDFDAAKRDREENYDDQRRFEVEFEPEATPEQIKQAIDLVASAFKLIREGR
jgi:hypothetical protein